VFGNENFSDSEVEDVPDSRVTLAEDFVGRGNRQSQKCAIRLKELGPRLTLELLKIEEEVCTGRVVYHKLVTKTPVEAQELVREKRRKEALKKQRREEQEAHVAEKAEKSKKRRRKVQFESGDQEVSLPASSSSSAKSEPTTAMEDDSVYYRSEMMDEDLVAAKPLSQRIREHEERSKSPEKQMQRKWSKGLKKRRKHPG